MSAAAFGLGWIIWQRHRLGLTLFAAYLALITFTFHFFASAIPEQILRVLTAPFGLGLLYLMGVVVNSDADLISTRSGYAHHLFTLPIPTRALILWPMLYGVGSVTLVWILYAALVLEPHGTTGLIWWPATLLAALTACLQALTWCPVPLPYLRGVFAFIILAGLTSFAAIGGGMGLSAGTLSAVYLGIIPIAALVAVRGVAHARVGESQEHTWLSERTPAHSPDTKFSSAAQAQLWLEEKRNGLLLPMMTLLYAILLAVPQLLHLKDDMAPLGIGTIETAVTIRMWLLCLLITPLSALTIGSISARAETLRPDLTLQPFLATRPISTLDLVRAKLHMAAISTLKSWAILGVFLCLWILLPAREGATYNMLGSLLLPHLTLKSALLAVVVFVSLVGLTWKNQVSGLWIILSGQPALINGTSVGVPMLIAGSIVWLVPRFSEDPTYGTQLAGYLPMLALSLALLKGAVATGALIALRRLNLVSAPTLLRFLSIWPLVAVVFGTLLRWLLPTDPIPTHYIVLGVFLYMPLTPLLLAPLALHKNRHR